MTLDPTVMVALMSMMVLEGWQFRLDPATSIMSSIETQLTHRSSWIGWLISWGSDAKAAEVKAA